MKKIRALIVDDESPARDNVRLLLAKDAEACIVGECANGFAAIEAIETLQPDVLFLDVQMPKLSGFDVLRQIDCERFPVVVFVTAYDQFALQAFEAHAFDYLLKPFSDARFAVSWQRAKEQVRQWQSAEHSRRLMGLLAQEEKFINRIVVRSTGRIQFLPVEEIDRIEAAGSYVELHSAGKNYLHRESLNSLESKLDPARFVRIHRSAIVNLSFVRQLQSHTHGEYLVTLSDGAQLKLSRSYRENLARLLETD
jgi:two-component system LytT family response regulator